MHRFYTDALSEGFASLTPEDARHALKVLRLPPGAEVEMICEGRRFRACLREGARLEPLEELPSTEARLRVTLFQGLPKADKMDWIVQKAVELGVARVVPVMMERCVSRPDARDLEKKVIRWNRIAREAGKQSCRCLIPEVTLPVQFSDLVRLGAELDACAVPWEEAASLGPLGFTRAHPALHSLGLLIGPEGGIAPGEIETIRPVFQPITLGPRILRTETAGLAAAAVFLALGGEMEDHP